VNKRQKKNKAEMIMNVYYRYIGESHVSNLIKELDAKKEEIDKIEVPETLDIWFKDFLNSEKIKEQKKKRAARFKKICSSTAVAAMVVLASMAIITFSVESVRAKVYDFLVKTYEEFSEIVIDKSNTEQAAIEGWDTYYYPEYLPEGYRYKDKSGNGEMKFIYFTNDTEELSLVQIDNETGVKMDPGKFEVIKIFVRNREGMLVINGESKMLYWSNDEYSFILTGINVQKEDLIRIAESIKKR
jgi:hypothetical protein